MATKEIQCAILCCQLIAASGGAFAACQLQQASTSRLRPGVGLPYARLLEQACAPCCACALRPCAAADSQGPGVAQSLLLPQPARRLWSSKSARARACGCAALMPMHGARRATHLTAATCGGWMDGWIDGWMYGCCGCCDAVMQPHGIVVEGPAHIMCDVMLYKPHVLHGHQRPPFLYCRTTWVLEALPAMVSRRNVPDVQHKPVRRTNGCGVCYAT